MPNADKGRIRSRASRAPATADSGSETPGSSRAPAGSLGEFLRAKRESMPLESAGLPARARRRTPGLRREDVAQLCGISAAWYTWIEQGRATAVSPQTLDALALGLRLSAAERAYLFRIAGCADPAPPPAPDTDVTRLAELTDAIRTPAYIIDAHWDALAWNRAAAALFTDWLEAGQRRSSRPTLRPPPNLLRYVFLHPRAPTFIVDWEQSAARLVAEYRADTPAWRDDPKHAALVTELTAASPVFSAGWRSQRVLSRDGGLRCFQHAQGRRAYQQHVLRLARQPALRLTVLTPD